MSLRRVLVSTAAAALLFSAAPVALADEPGSDEQPLEAPRVSRHVVPGHDGTPLVVNLFEPAGLSAEQPGELILETHGWGGTGRTSPGGMTGRLVDDGYVVLTWDQRGFGCSDGQVRIDDPQVEGRDVSALIDWAMGETHVRTDGTTSGGEPNPVVGMIGGSYAGGIQTAAASLDERIDALAPDMSWSDLRYSLYPGEVVKQGWITLLYALGTLTAEGQGLDPQCDDGPTPFSGLDPAIHRGVTEFVATGKVSDTTLDFFAGSSLAHYGDEHPVDVPTLVTQSAIDTLFNLTDGLGIHEHVLDQGADSRLLIYCGGHVNCPTTYADADDTGAMRDAIQDWFEVHLRGGDRDLGPAIEYRTNEGVWRGLDELPRAADGLTVAGEATSLPVVPVLELPDLATTFRETDSSGGSLQATPLTAAAVSHDRDPRTVTLEVARAEDGPLELVGVPEVELTVDGVLLDTLGELPDELLDDVLAQLSLEGLEPVTDAAGEVIGAAPVVGNVLQGALGGLLGVTAADALPTDVHLFAKLVHRESGEVVNLQEGAARVGLVEGPTSVSLTMPGLAYTIPEGDHLDLQVSTASLMHATGRLPALVDVAVQAAVPVVGATEQPPTDPEDPPGEEPPVDDDPPVGPPDDRPGPPEDRPPHGERGGGPPGDLPGPPVGGAAPGSPPGHDVRPAAHDLAATPAAVRADVSGGALAALLATLGAIAVGVGVARHARGNSDGAPTVR
jgi:ABC-2 type transport system ATP-binding protein